jgi:aryl-alcohol dehydrogenase-like predicted oxidoreductase
MKVVVKESLANGRLAGSGRRDAGSGNEEGILSPAVAQIREVAEARGTTIEKLALAAALARPWADVVLTGAATETQIRASVAALKVPYDDELEKELRPAAIASEEYWRARSSFEWN